MRIHDDHMYHGAALIQVAEHPSFKAINQLKINGHVEQTAYQINDDTALYLKYAKEPTEAYDEYQFTFKAEHIAKLTEIAAKKTKTLVAMVCIKDRAICCVPFEKIKGLIAARKQLKGADEAQYTVLVTAMPGKELRVYVNVPGQKGASLGIFKVPRNSFPDVVFD